MAQTRRYCLLLRPFDLMPSKRLPLLDISSFNRSSFVNLFGDLFALIYDRAVYRYGALRSWANSLRRSPQNHTDITIARDYDGLDALAQALFPPAVTSYRRGIRILLFEHHRIVGGSILRNPTRRYC